MLVSPPPAFVVRWGWVVLSGAIGLHLIAIAIWPKALTQLLDLGVYRAGGQAVLSGTPLYSHAVFEGLFFTYPPFAAVAFIPFALIPYGLLKVLFSVVNLAALGLILWLCWRRLGHRADRGLVAVVVALTGVLFWLEPVRSTIDVGQVNLLLTLLLLWDLTGSHRFRGVGVGLAAGIKLIPGIFIVYLLITRRFRAALVASGVFAATVGVGFLTTPGNSVRYWRDTFLATNRIGKVAEPGNQSLAGVFARLGVPGWLLAAVVLGILGLAAARLAHRRGQELAAVTIVGLTACVVSPFTWNHHWVWFVPAVVLLLHYSRRLLFPVGLVLLTLDWPVALTTAPDRNTPGTGLIMASVPDALALVTRNLYPLLAALLITLAVRHLSNSGGEPRNSPRAGRNWAIEGA